MLEYIRGEITEITPTYVVLDCNGLGYYINISLNTYTYLQNQQTAKIFFYEAIREDAHILYGFKDKDEREMFLLLISVSGVGPNTARMILSSFTVEDLRAVIASGNAGQLKAVKGIGAKTAQRIIVDTKDKIGIDSGIVAATAGSAEIYDEAITALTILGYPKAAAQKVVSKLFKENPSLKVEDIIKLALKML